MCMQSFTISNLDWNQVQDLKREAKKIGVNMTFGNYKVKITGYDNSLEQLIQYVFDNFDNARIKSL